MTIDFNSLRLVVLNLALSFENLGAEAAEQFLAAVVAISRDAARDQKIELEDMWTVEVLLPEHLLKSRMENRKMYSILDSVMDVFGDNGVLQVGYGGEALRMLEIPIKKR